MKDRAYTQGPELLQMQANSPTIVIDPLSSAKSPIVSMRPRGTDQHIARPVPIATDSRGYALAKRSFDVSFASLLLIVTAPVWIFAALLVKFTSAGPILFRQQRVGRGGDQFTCYKFRSMVEGAEAYKHHLWHRNEADGPVFKMRGDPRVTTIGIWMRKFSIDELPQLLNVLRGEMSIVGPRPPEVGEVDHYSAHQLKRLAVKPGLTCIWQVSGRSNISFDEWVEMDLDYIRRRSIPLDLNLTLRTIPAVLFARGAH